MQTASLVHWCSIPYNKILAWAEARLPLTEYPKGFQFNDNITHMQSAPVLDIGASSKPPLYRGEIHCQSVKNSTAKAASHCVMSEMIWDLCRVWTIPWRQNTSCNSNKLCKQNIASNALCHALDHVPSTFGLFSIVRKFRGFDCGLPLNVALAMWENVSAVKVRSRDANNKMLGLLCQSASF